MTSSEIRNWLAIVAVIAGGAWSYFQLNSDVNALRETIGTLEQDLPTSVSTAREAAVASINQAETQALREISAGTSDGVSRVENAFSSNGRFTLGGTCFEVRKLVNCRAPSDNYTFIDEECAQYSGYREAHSIAIIAECK